MSEFGEVWEPWSCGVLVQGEGERVVFNVVDFFPGGGGKE